MTLLLRHLFFTLCLLLPTAAFAQERLAVLEFTGKLDPDVLQTLTDEARGGATRILQKAGADYIVMSRENMNIILSDMGIDDVCLAEGECEVETARNLNAAYVVSGSALNIEGTYLVNIKLHNTGSGALLGVETARGKSLLDTVDATAAVVQGLLNEGMDLGVDLRSSGLSYRAPAVVAGERFSSGNLGVAALLKEQNCKKAAAEDAQLRVKRTLDGASGKMLREAQEDWASLKPQIEGCVELDAGDYGEMRRQCAQQLVDYYAHITSLQAVSLAGTEEVSTECGVRVVPLKTQTRMVEARTLTKEVERLFRRLSVSGLTLRKGTPTSDSTFKVEDLGTQKLLEQQACQQTAESTAILRVDTRLKAAADDVRNNAAEEWAKLDLELRACPQIEDALMKRQCVEQAEAFIAFAEAQAVSTAAGVEEVNTSCGPLSVAVATQTRKVEMSDYVRLAQLRLRDLPSAPKNTQSVDATRKSMVRSTSTAFEQCAVGSLMECAKYRQESPGAVCPLRSIDRVSVDPSRLAINGYVAHHGYVFMDMGVENDTTPDWEYKLQGRSHRRTLRSTMEWCGLERASNAYAAWRHHRRSFNWICYGTMLLGCPFGWVTSLPASGVARAKMTRHLKSSRSEPSSGLSRTDRRWYPIGIGVGGGQSYGLYGVSVLTRFEGKNSSERPERAFGVGLGGGAFSLRGRQYLTYHLYTEAMVNYMFGTFSNMSEGAIHASIAGGVEAPVATYDKGSVTVDLSYGIGPAWTYEVRAVDPSVLGSTALTTGTNTTTTAFSDAGATGLVEQGHFYYGFAPVFGVGINVNFE